MASTKVQRIMTQPIVSPRPSAPACSSGIPPFLMVLLSLARGGWWIPRPRVRVAVEPHLPVPPERKWIGTFLFLIPTVFVFRCSEKLS